MAFVPPSPPRYPYPFLRPLTILAFSETSVRRDRRRPMADYEKQLAVIGHVCPRARRYLKEAQTRYVALKEGRQDATPGVNAIDLPVIAAKGPYVLAELLDIIAQPYTLSCPNSVIDTAMRWFPIKDYRRLMREDACFDDFLHVYFSLAPAWHLQQARSLTEVADYLDVAGTVRDFINGQTRDQFSELRHRSATSLRQQAKMLRRIYTHVCYADWRRQTKPIRYVLEMVLSRLWQFFMDLTGQPCLRLIVALIQTAPYSSAYEHYRHLSYESVRRHFTKSGRTHPPYPWF